jgi:hypothetical protein
MLNYMPTTRTGDMYGWTKQYGQWGENLNIVKHNITLFGR